MQQIFIYSKIYFKRENWNCWETPRHENKPYHVGIVHVYSRNVSITCIGKHNFVIHCLYMQVKGLTRQIKSFISMKHSRAL